MIKKRGLLLIAAIFALLLNPMMIKAENATITIDFFYGNTCPHCAVEEVFLEELKNDYANVTVNYYEVFDSTENQGLMQQRADALGINVTGVPFTIINDQYFIGYTEGYTDAAIRDIVDGMIADGGRLNYVIDIPLIGTINTADLSLPLVTIVLGVIDGFNPCAMWVLLFLLSLLIGTHDRKRVWSFGLTFILASAAMYFMFMAAWLNLTMFIGSAVWVRTLIAVLAISGGSWNLYHALKKNADGCEIVDDKKRNKIFERIKRFTAEKSYFLALGGIILLAVSINLIELLCSAGIPVIYTQILALNQVSSVGYYLYILLYIVFFMIDDIIVFTIAVISMKLTGISAKYGKISHLIGAVLLIIIGTLLIVAPGLLMFG